VPSSPLAFCVELPLRERDIMTATSLTVTIEDAARYDAASPARALKVAGDRAAWDGSRLRITAANGKELSPEDGQVVVRYAPGDVGVMDEGEYRRFFGGVPA
jgi:hypothetical protein